jgi:hypothetical protein
LAQASLQELLEGLAWLGSLLDSPGLSRVVQKGRWYNHGSYHKVGKDSNHWLKRRRKSFWMGWRGLDRRWIHWVCRWRFAGIITGAITRLARTPTSGSSVVARVSGRAGVASIVAGFTGLVAGEVKWSKRVAEIITGAITRSARTPISGSSVVARVVGRADVAWIVAGFTGLVAGEVKCSERVAEIIRGAIKQSE